MKDYLFAEPGALRKLGSSKEQVQDVLSSVARDTPAEALVTCVYLLRRSRGWRGVYYRSWQDPDSFRARRGHWRISTRFETPADLPQRYRLIRVLIGARLTYPMRARDRSGFEHSYQSFRDHLADLFAHELHHYRRYHLGLHPREGEAGANRWALKRVRSLNFAVEGKQIPRPRPRTFSPAIWIRELLREDLPLRRKLASSQSLAPEDLHRLMPPAMGVGTKRRLAAEKSLKRELHHERLRLAPTGSKLRVTYRFDDRLKRGEIVTLVRPLRRPSPRIAVGTAQGKEWWTPMDWLELVTNTSHVERV